MPVYFVRAGKTGPVKIGWAGDPFSRLVKMQADNHEALQIVRLFEGGREDEAELHQVFSAHRIRGEWFCPVEAILAGPISLPALPAQRQPRRYIYTPWSDETRTRVAAERRHRRETDPEYAARAAAGHKKTSATRSRKAAEWRAQRAVPLSHQRHTVPEF